MLKLRPYCSPKVSKVFLAKKYFGLTYMYQKRNLDFFCWALDSFPLTTLIQGTVLKPDNLQDGLIFDHSPCSFPFCAIYALSCSLTIWSPQISLSRLPWQLTSDVLGLANGRHWLFRSRGEKWCQQDGRVRIPKTFPHKETPLRTAAATAPILTVNHCRPMPLLETLQH